MSQVLTLLGPIQNFMPERDPNDEAGSEAESEGPFILADARDALRWGGLRATGRWKTKLLGQLAELPIQLPFRGARYAETQKEALENYANLRAAIEAAMPDAPIVPYDDTPSTDGSRVDAILATGDNGEPGGPVGILLCAEVNDYDFAMDMVRGLACLKAGNYDGPKVVAYRPPPPGCLVAVGNGQNGAADHIVIAFCPGGAPADDDVKAYLESGLPGAAPDGNHTDITIDVTSGVLVAFWSRLAGGELLGWTEGQDPAKALSDWLGDNTSAPLPPGVPGMLERGGQRCGWVFRVNPGKWTARYWYVDTADGAGLSCCAFSRDGVPSFQPLMHNGGANGLRIAGITLEDYAELSAERDRLYMRASTASTGLGAMAALVGNVSGFGAAQGELDALCDRFGVPHAPYGMAGRITEWDQTIQGDANLSAEFAAFYSIANAKLDGIDPSTINTDAVAAQARANADFVSKNAKKHEQSNEATTAGHYGLFEVARKFPPDQVLRAAREKAYAHLSEDDLAWAFDRAAGHLKLHATGAKKIDKPVEVCASFFSAMYDVMPANEKPSSKAKFIKQETDEVKEAYGLSDPGLFGWVTGMIDKIMG